jgi:CRISPR-associated protein Csh2
MINILSHDENEFANLIEFKKWLEDNAGVFKKKEEIEQLNNIEFKNYVLSKLGEKAKKEEIKKIIDERILEIKTQITATVFAKCIDTKLFGVTYTGEGPLSLTGPVQISYGINRYNESTNYINDILSPYPTGDEGTIQSSIGKEVKNLESYYVYDFSINPKNIVTHYNDREDLKAMMQITNDDIENLKKALKNSVTSLDTTSKIGSENAMLLFITLPENSEKFLPAMKNLVKITKTDDGKAKINLSKVEELISDKQLGAAIELSYNHHLTEVVCEGTGWQIEDKM